MSEARERAIGSSVKEWWMALPFVVFLFHDLLQALDWLMRRNSSGNLTIRYPSYMTIFLDTSESLGPFQPTRCKGFRCWIPLLLSHFGVLLSGPSDS